jgi:hypothetical protein
MTANIPVAGTFAVIGWSDGEVWTTWGLAVDIPDG